MAQKDIGNKVPLHTLKKVEDVAAYYDEWAINNKYDKDMEAWNYTGPKETSETFNKYQKNKNIEIFDAGCGTGLVAIELKKMGYRNFYGADISQKLLDLAPHGLYKSLERIDLNKKLIYEDDKFDSIFCVGTFTFGHVKPDALDEFIRITKKNGLICFTINVGVFKDYGFDKKINDLIDKNKWEKLEFFKSDYLSSKDVNAWLGIYKVTK